MNVSVSLPPILSLTETPPTTSTIRYCTHDSRVRRDSCFVCVQPSPPRTRRAARSQAPPTARKHGIEGVGRITSSTGLEPICRPGTDRTARARVFGDGSVCLRTHLTDGVLAHRPSPKAGPTIHRVESIKTQLEGRDHITARAALNSVTSRHRVVVECSFVGCYI